MDLGKINLLMMVRSSQLTLLPQLKNDVLLKSDQNWLKNKQLASLIEIRYTLCTILLWSTSGVSNSNPWKVHIWLKKSAVFGNFYRIGSGLCVSLCAKWLRILWNAKSLLFKFLQKKTFSKFFLNWLQLSFYRII